jgi:hypothetical protein
MTDEIEEEHYELRLTADGKLLQKEWVYDRDAGVGSYVINDKSNNLYDYLDKLVEVEAGFTLDQLFALVETDHEIHNIVMRDCWIKPFINEWKKIHANGYVAPVHEYSPNEIEYLELSWHAELDGKGKGAYLWGTDRPQFDGQGWELRDDKPEDWGGYKKGTRISYGLDFAELSTLLHLPIVIREELKVYEDLVDTNARFVMGGSENEVRVVFECKKKYTLKDVISGVFWELSFHGAPEDVVEQRAVLEERIADLNESIRTEDMSKFTEFKPEDYK